MQAITTKYLGPTNHRGSRIKATCDAGSLTLTWDHSLSAPENHRLAARALVQRLGWGGKWIGGGTATGYAFVCAHRDTDLLLVSL